MTVNLSPKHSKVYQIAVELAQYESPQHSHALKLQHQRSNTSVYRLPKILDVDEDYERTTRRKQSPFKNIFNNLQKNEHMKPDQLSNDKSYNIVGRKEVKSYLTKLVKKRNPYQRRNQSGLSLSRYSSSVKSQHQANNYLNKQDVLNFIKPINQQFQNLAMTKNQQMLTIETNKSCLSMDLFSLKKNRDVFESYNKTWDKEKLKKLKFPSILDHISSYRSKVEIQQGNSLMQQKLHTKDKVWVDTLRTEKNTENYYNDKYVEKIINNSMDFGLKGRDKLQKEMQWIDEKDKAGYSFAFIEGWTSGRGGHTNTKVQKDNIRQSYEKDEPKTRQSQMNGNIRMGTGNSNHRQATSRNDQTRKKTIIRSQSMGGMKGILRANSRLPSQLTMTKQFSQPQLMNSRNLSFTMTIKNRPTVIMTNSQSPSK